MENKEFRNIITKNYALYLKYAHKLSNRIDLPEDVLQEAMLNVLENIDKLCLKLNNETEVNKYIYTIIQFSNYRKDGRTNLSPFQAKYNKMKFSDLGDGLKNKSEDINFDFEEKYNKLDELIAIYDNDGIIEDMIHSNNPKIIKKNNLKIYNKVVNNMKKHIKNYEKQKCSK